MKYLKMFESHSGYETFTQGDEFIKPNVSHCVQENEVHYNPIADYSKKYLRTTALNDGEIGFNFTSYIDSESFNFISYSTNNGSTWITVQNESGNTISIPVSAGDSILWKGSGTSMCYIERGSGYIPCSFTSSTNCQFDVDGNIMSLLYCDDFIGKTELPVSEYISLGGVFGNSNVVNAKNLILPATTLADGCYATMFWQCLNLVTAPELPATTLARSCYSDMFNGCTSLITAPELPATTLANWCYSYMFNGCTSLNSITCLATDISATNCTFNWVNGVAASGTFTKAPSMTGWTTGTSGIPDGWTVETAS